MPEPHTPGWLLSSVGKLLALVPRLAARWPWAASITAAALIGYLGYSIAQDSGWSPAATFGLTLGGLTATLVLIASALTIYDWDTRRQAPLMILHDHTETCIENEYWTATEPHHVVRQTRRVKVVNRSDSTALDGVKLQVEAMEPRGAPFLPEMLREMNDQPDKEKGEQFITSFKLNPGETKVFAVALKLTNSPNWIDDAHFHWQWASHVHPTPIPHGTYAITLIATAKGVPARRRSYRVAVDDDGRLTMAGLSRFQTWLTSRRRA